MEEKKKKKQEEKTDVTQKKVRENLLHRVTPCLAWKFCFCVLNVEKHGLIMSECLVF